MNVSNSKNHSSDSVNAEPLYKGDFFGRTGEYWTEIDWYRTRTDSSYCEAVIKRFKKTAYLHKCTIKNQDKLFSEKMISDAERDLPFVRDCIRKLQALLEEIERKIVS